MGTILSSLIVFGALNQYEALDCSYMGRPDSLGYETSWPDYQPIAVLDCPLGVAFINQPWVTLGGLCRAVVIRENELLSPRLGYVASLPSVAKGCRDITELNFFHANSPASDFEIVKVLKYLSDREKAASLIEWDGEDDRRECFLGASIHSVESVGPDGKSSPTIEIWMKLCGRDMMLSLIPLGDEYKFVYLEYVHI